MWRRGFSPTTEIVQLQRRELPANWDRNLPVFPASPTGLAGRDASGKVLNVLAQNIPWFLGGSADLGPSNKTILTFEGAGQLQAASPDGRNMHFGIREHSMGAIVNGMSLSKLRPSGATFFIFSDYARPAIRLSALMELPTLFVFTHDELILIATGSEVSLAVEAHEQLVAEGIRSRVVSMPSWDIFELQPREYRDAVLPPGVTARVAIEQASTFGWERYVGTTGRVVGMKTSGASAPLKALQRKFGFEPDDIVTVAKQIVGEVSHTWR